VPTTAQLGGTLLIPLRGKQSRHLLAFHRWGFFDFAAVLELLQHTVDDALAFFNVLHFAATELHLQHHLVAFLQEFASLVDARINVVFAGLGPNAKFLEFLLVRLLARLLGLGVLELTVIHDLANRGSLRGRDFHEVQTEFAGHFEGLLGGHNAVLFAFSSDEANWADADLFVEARASQLRTSLVVVAVE
jgi:hypothetical protein